MEITSESKNLLNSGGFLLLAADVGSKQIKFRAEGFCISARDLNVTYSQSFQWFPAQFSAFSRCARRIHLRCGILRSICFQISELHANKPSMVNTLSELLTESLSIPNRGELKMIIHKLLVISCLRRAAVRFPVSFFGWHSPCA